MQYVINNNNIYLENNNEVMRVDVDFNVKWMYNYVCDVSF